MDLITGAVLLIVGGKYFGAKKPTGQNNQINANTLAQTGEMILNSERPLGQNVYATDDLLRSNLDLERRANEVYPVAVAKEQAAKKWAKPQLESIDGGSRDGAWTLYAAPVRGEQDVTVPGSIEDSPVGLSTFASIPFNEKPYLKGSTNKNLPIYSRKYEQMNNVGVGGYQPKTEQTADVNGAQNPFSVGLVDNIARYDPQQRLASTHDGENLPGNTSVNDSSNTFRNYFAAAVPRVKAQTNINPTTELRIDGMSGGNADPMYSAPALKPQNYGVNHRRNVDGTMVNQIQRGNQITLNQPQGYNEFDQQNTIPERKLKSLADVKARWGAAFVDRGQSGITAANISQLNHDGSIPQTSIEASTRTNDVTWNSGRFAQLDNFNNGSQTGIRDNIFVGPTLKDQTLYTHQGHASNQEAMNAGYLSRKEPMRVTMKETLVRPMETGVAVQHRMPQQGNYQNDAQHLDVQMTNAASITPVMTRTAGFFADGDITRDLPSAPSITNKEINSSLGGQVIAGGAGSAVSASAVRGWAQSDRKDGLEVVDNRAFIPSGNDSGLYQLGQEGEAIGSSLRQTKEPGACQPVNFGVNQQRNLPSQQDFKASWQAGMRQPKRG